jgi:spore germination cell wall hydrolase CwlJ-like protein
LRKWIDWAETFIAWSLVVAVGIGWFHFQRAVEHSDFEFVSEAELYKIRMDNMKIIENLPPPYANCAFEHAWCGRLAEALVYEARSEGAVGMRAVAYVVLERVKSKGWPNSIREVITQRKQFSYLEDKDKQTKPTQEDFDLAYKEAYDAVFGISENPVPGAKWYHAKGASPKRWMKVYKPTYTIGNHVFYTEE